MGHPALIPQFMQLDMTWVMSDSDAILVAVLAGGMAGVIVYCARKLFSAWISKLFDTLYTRRQQFNLYYRTMDADIKRGAFHGGGK
jgi:hypothetical protein